MKGIFFDLDGTIIYSMDFWEKIMKMYLESKNLEYKEVLYQRLRVSPVSETEKIFNQIYGDEIDFSGANRDMDLIIREHIADFYNMKDGVLEKLKELREHGFKMCVTTATPSKYVIPLSKKMGFYDYLDHIFTVDMLKINKNEAAFFEKALELMGTKAEETYVFDDALYSLKNAKSLGMIPVGVYDDSNKHETEEIKKIAKFYINSFSDLDVSRL